MRSLGGRWAAGALAAALAACAVSCRREDPRIRELTVKAAQADDAARQLRQAWSAQLARLPLLRRRPAPGPLAIPFTPEQIRFLQARVNAERDVSYKALLREALDKDREIRDLGLRLGQMKADLPPPDVVRPHDSHYGLAMRFLRSRGVPDAKARDLLSRTPILERLEPGSEVYHFYVDGVYGTFVAQGSAPHSPAELAKLGDLEELQDARNQARARSGRLGLALAELQAQKAALDLEVSELRIERERLMEERGSLEDARVVQAASLNSLHYLVGLKDDLERAGIIELPFLAKSRAGAAWRDAAFTELLDLRGGNAIRIQAGDLGLERIGSVDLVPGSYLRDVHYRLAFDGDRKAVTVVILNPARFRNDKVVFAVSD